MTTAHDYVAEDQTDATENDYRRARQLFAFVWGCLAGSVLIAFHDSLPGEWTIGLTLALVFLAIRGLWP